MAKFVDYAKIQCVAGDGGDGCASFRREKYVARGGPDGGDGGKGGDVVLVGDPHLATLLDFRYRTHYVARDGANGARKQCSGHGGADRVIDVPLGTVVVDADTEEVLADVTQPGQRFIVAHGGKGGRGNQHFATATNRAPHRFEPGVPGETRNIILELKMIADVGIVGLPNAGKSTLLRKLTAATPKVASYPFTTLHPNLGVIEFDEGLRLVLADLPGLIEGASQGAGLGHRFLRHIERTGALLHLVTDEEGVFDPKEIESRIEMVEKELRQYSDALAEKPSTLVLSQIDRALDADDLEATRAALEERHGRVMAMSSETGAGLEELREALREMARKKRDEIEANDREQTLNIEHRTSNAQRSTSNAQLSIRNDHR